MTSLRINLFGTFQVQVAETPITEFHSNKVRALLAYLAAEAGRPHERPMLASLLWPEEPLEKALTNLRQVLHRLAQALEPLGLAEPLLNTRQSVQLHPSILVELDFEQFGLFVGQVRGHEHRRLTGCRQCMALLEQALQLYRGDFMAGFGSAESLAFEEWMLVRRERLKEQCAWALATLAAHQEQAGNHLGAIAYLRRWLELEPWHEQAHRRLMLALACSGERNSALMQFEQCRRWLARELSVEPAMETLELASSIRRNALRALLAPAFSGPAPASALVGRQAELGEIASQISGVSCKLLTLVGPGGVGKTRLALEAAIAERGCFADGIFFIPLAGVPSADLLPDTLAAQLGVDLRQGEQDALQVLCAYLRSRELLLVLDNMEHLLDGSAILAELLQAAPQLRLLVTSREPLRLASEWLLAVDGLALPPLEAEQPQRYPAPQLFISLARQLSASFAPGAEELALITRICYAVGGLPLAISLAAGLSRQHPLCVILAEIERDLDVLTSQLRDAPERHRSLRALFNSAWATLSHQERFFLMHCSLFTGEFSGEAAAHVAGRLATSERVAPALETLVEKSLIQRGADGRYLMHDLVRRFAAEALASHEDGAALGPARSRYSAYYLSLVARSADQISGPDGRLAFASLQREIGDIQVAWRQATERGDLSMLAVTMQGLFNFYRAGGASADGVAIFGSAVERMRELVSARGGRSVAAQSQLGHLLVAWAELLYTTGDYSALVLAAEEARAIARAIARPELEAGALVALGKVLWRRGESKAAQAHLRQAYQLIRRNWRHYGGNQRLRSDIHYYLGLVAWNQGDFCSARAHYLAALRIARAISYRYCEADALNNLSLLTIFEGHYDQALAYAQQALAIYRSSGNRAGEGLGLISLGLVQMYLFEDSPAYASFTASLEIHTQISDRQNISMARILLGMLCTRMGDLQTARSWLDSGLALCRELGHIWGLSIGLAYNGLLRHLAGDQQAALRACQEALALTEQTHDPVISAYALTHMGHALAATGRQLEASESYQRALAIYGSLGQRHLAVEPMAGLVRLALARGELPRALEDVEEILSICAATRLRGVEDPARIMLSCYHALIQAGQDRAIEVLEGAIAQLTERASLQEHAVLRNALYETSANRELLTLWEALQQGGLSRTADASADYWHG